MGCRVHVQVQYVAGYGCSEGRASEKNLYADIAAALQALKTRYGVLEEQVILYGQSIGTVPSVDLASASPAVAGLVLHSPLMSGLRVACGGVQRTWCCDAFPSIEKIPRVKCPTLVIHGTEDDVIDFSHGLTLYENCPSSVEPLWVAGAGECTALFVKRFLTSQGICMWMCFRDYGNREAAEYCRGRGRRPKACMFDGPRARLFSRDARVLLILNCYTLCTKFFWLLRVQKLLKRKKSEK